MDFATIQAQIANLTSLVSQYAERTTRQSVPTFGESYRQEYQVDQHPQRGWESDKPWGYHDPNQPRKNLFPNTYNSDWSDHSNSMCWEPQQVRNEAYWQPSEQFYSEPMHPPQQFQSNSSMPMTNDEILDVLTSLTQGSQQEEYMLPSKEFYHWPYEPSQPPQQSAQFNSGTSLDNDTFNKLLTSLNQEVQTQNKERKIQDKRVDNLEKQIGQILEFMAQIQEQSELSNSTIENSNEDFEIHDTITLGSAMEVEADLETSKHSLEVDEELLIVEEEEDIHTPRVKQPLPQSPKAPTPSTTSKDVPNSFHSNVIPPNAPFPRRFLIPKKDESEKDILEAIPMVQSDIPILGTPNQVPDCVEVFKQPCTPRTRSQEKEVAGECVKCIKEAIYETTKPKEVEFDDTGQVTTIVVNLATCKVPATFKDVVFVLEFVSEHKGKPPPRISISCYTNRLLMIQAPTQEFKPLPDHFKYHHPFKDKFHDLEPRGV